VAKHGCKIKGVDEDLQKTDSDSHSWPCVPAFLDELAVRNRI
jgi:hypothetical protein